MTVEQIEAKKNLAWLKQCANRCRLEIIKKKINKLRAEQRKRKKYLQEAMNEMTKLLYDERDARKIL